MSNTTKFQNNRLKLREMTHEILPLVTIAWPLNTRRERW